MGEEQFLLAGWRRRSLLVGVLAGLMLILAGCGGSSNEPEATSEPVLPTATPQPTAALNIGSVLFAQSIDATGAPVDPASELPRDVQVIYAAVEVRNVFPGTSFSAEWTMDGQPIPDLSTSTTLADGAVAGWVTFSLTWSGQTLWPVGTLGVTVTSDAGQTSTGTVQITTT
jgi:hypothetical protein